MKEPVGLAGNDRSVCVGFLTEGTYPHSGGGVSTWSDLLIRGLHTYRFHLLAATSQTFRKTRYDLPQNVLAMTQIPLWGANAIDSVRQITGATALARQKRSTTEQVIEQQFASALKVWLQCLFATKAEFDGEACGGAVLQMARFLRVFDYSTVFRSKTVWAVFSTAVASWYDPVPTHGSPRPSYTIDELITSLHWLTALLRPLAVSAPDVDLFHATVAASVGLIGVVARREAGIPLLLTEHGVYLRERAINVGTNHDFSFFQKHFLIRMADITTRLCYYHADLVAPVCQFNGKWETRLGADPAKIEVIYNAVDTDRFRRRTEPSDTTAPVIVTMANVVPIKDILTLINAAVEIRQTFPDVCVWVYGSLTADVKYAAKCRQLIESLHLSETVELRGRHPSPEQVYPKCDLVALPSISEAFPFTVLEAMACGKPVVATDVGGVSEALGEAGIVVPPRSPSLLAEAIINLLNDSSRRRTLGNLGRKRALQHFRTQHLLNAYDDVYTKLSCVPRPSQATDRGYSVESGMAS